MTPPPADPPPLQDARVEVVLLGLAVDADAGTVIPPALFGP